MGKKTPHTPSEHDEQAAVIRWALMMEYAYPELVLLYAIPNAAKRSFKLANYMKTEGMKSGVPDLCLPVARSGYHGLYIEMKRKGGPNPTKDQESWLKRLSDAGYYAVCCKGAEAAKNVLHRYVIDRFDDCQVVRLEAEKVYDDTPKTIIQIEPVCEDCHKETHEKNG